MSSATQARALVASLLRGDLETTVHTSQVQVLRFEASVLPLRRTPVTAVSSVMVDGSAVTEYSFTPFALVREPTSLTGPLWPAGVVTVTYTTGWDEGYEPSEVQEAIALATQHFDANPGSGITSFREGAESVTVSQQEALAAILRLLGPWVRA